MPLPEPVLDDLRFQKDLVDEARRRIIRYCPEWTDYNVSDPGITLIELFAWMTELITYRLNRVPEKNFFKFMELIGIHLQPASSARTDLTFWLSAPFPLSPEDTTVATVPQGTEVSTISSEGEPEIVFTTDQRLTIIPPDLTQVRREADFHKNYAPRMGIETFYAFSQPRPQEGDTFYLGFDENQDISGHILQLAFQCEETQAVGIRREDPPLIWECSLGNGQWQEVSPSNRPSERDTTGGLNNPLGSMVLYLPLTMKVDHVNGRNGYWLRCRFEPRRPEQGRYSEPPRIIRITAYSLGAAVPATHAIFVYGEEVGLSKGEAGQLFQLRHAPVLSLLPGETVEVEESRHGEVVYVPWQLVPDFSNSTRYDRHFSLDTATGEVAFGPSVRQRDGSVIQYGRVPEAGRRIRFSQYRYGGGVIGNVPTGKLQTLRSAIPYIDRVANLIPARGGRDQESLTEAKMRVPQELRAQQRAVTADDYENLSKTASRSIARVKCVAAGSGAKSPPPGTVELLAIPAVLASIEAGDLARLSLDERLKERLMTHLDRYRLLTTKVIVREPDYLGVKVQAEIVVSEYSQPELVKQRVLDYLRQFITPLALKQPDPELAQFLGGNWEGWPFGRDLYVAELYTLIQLVPGVKHVLDVQLSHRQVVPAQEELAATESDEAEAPVEQVLTTIEGRSLKVPPDTVLCSLDHEIEIVEL